jgi:hypothetical protein
MPDRQRKARKARKNADQQSKRRKAYISILSHLDLEADFRTLPLVLREYLLQHPYPKPKVVIDGSAHGNPDAAAIQSRIEAFLLDAKMILDNGHTLALNKFFTLLTPLLHRFQSIKLTVPDPKWPKHVERSIAILADCVDKNSGSALITLFRGVDKILIEYSKIDKGIWWTKAKCEPLPKVGKKIVIALHLTLPQSIKVGLDGKRPQKAFLCSAPFGSEELKWVNWDAATVKKKNDQRSYPVYVTQHTLDRLRERITLTGPEVEDFMWQSLTKPILRDADRTDEFLCEYRLGGHLLGYFPIRREADRIICKTFLFLTMQGTPESRLLNQRLRLVRKDIEEKDLNALGLFLTTDIQDDPVLRKIFNECGCGHLFDMAKPELRATAQKGFAEDMRKFLRIDNRASRIILGDQ